MLVVLSSQAELDLERIADFIGEDAPERAISFVLELDAKARELAEFPQRFPLIPSLAHLGICRRAWGNYLIVYRAEPDRVYVLRYIHGARDYEPLLGGSE